MDSKVIDHSIREVYFPSLGHSLPIEQCSWSQSFRPGELLFLPNTPIKELIPHRDAIVDILGEKTDEQTLANLTVSTHQSGLRLEYRKGQDGFISENRKLFTEMISDPDKGIIVDIIDTKNTRIQKAVWEELHPINVAHALGLIEELSGRAEQDSGFDARVRLTGSLHVVNLSIKTVHPKDLTTLGNKTSLEGKTKLYKMICPLLNDRTSVLLLLPFVDLDNTGFLNLLSRIKQEGIESSRILILPLSLIEYSGTVFTREKSFMKPVGEFHIAAWRQFLCALSIEQDPLFDKISPVALPNKQHLKPLANACHIRQIKLALAKIKQSLE